MHAHRGDIREGRENPEQEGGHAVSVQEGSGLQ